jgi:hypothetical protein
MRNYSTVPAANLKAAVAVMKSAADHTAQEAIAGPKPEMSVLYRQEPREVLRSKRRPPVFTVLHRDQGMSPHFGVSV